MTFIAHVESGDLIHRSALRSARFGGPYRNITTEEAAPTIAPKVRIETLGDETNYDLPEVRTAIKERLPDLAIRGPETLVETVEDESPMTEDINVNAIDMLALLCRIQNKTILKIHQTTQLTKPHCTSPSVQTLQRYTHG